MPILKHGIQLPGETLWQGYCAFLGGFKLVCHRTKPGLRIVTWIQSHTQKRTFSLLLIFFLEKPQPSTCKVRFNKIMWAGFGEVKNTDCNTISIPS